MQLLIKDLKISTEINEEWISENCYIAGGACVSNFTRSPIHDVDIYFKTKKARKFFMEKSGYLERYFEKNSILWTSLIYYSNRIEDEEIEIGDESEVKIGDEKFVISSEMQQIDSENVLVYVIDGTDYIPKPLFEKQKWMFENGYDYVLIERNHFDVDGKTFLGNKSITFEIDRDGTEKMRYQFILRFCGNPEEMMDKTFDFQHCKIAYDLKTHEYIASPETYQCLSRRELKYVNSFYPISSLKRMRKYEARGYKYSTNEFVKIIRDIHNVDVDNKFVLEDQLIGYYEDFDYNQVFCGKDMIDDLPDEPF